MQGYKFNIIFKPRLLVKLVHVLDKLKYFRKTWQKNQNAFFILFIKRVKPFNNIAYDYTCHTHSSVLYLCFQMRTLILFRFLNKIPVLLSKVKFFVRYNILNNLVQVKLFHVEASSINFNYFSRIPSLLVFNLIHFFCQYPLIFTLVIQSTFFIPIKSGLRWAPTLFFSFQPLCLLLVISLLSPFVSINVFNVLYGRFAEIICKKLEVESC